MRRFSGAILGLSLVGAVTACEPLYPDGAGTGTRFGTPIQHHRGPSAPDQQPGPIDTAIDPSTPDITEPEPTDPGDPWSDPYVDTYTDLQLQNAHLSGSMGVLADVSGDQVQLSGFEQDGWASVSTTVTSNVHIAMTIFEVMGDLDDPMFAPGSRVHFGADGYNVDDPDGYGVWMNVVGCANEDDTDFNEGYDFDQGAEDVVLSVDQIDENTLSYDYAATFVSYDQYGGQDARTEVRGSFERVLTP